MSSSALPTIVVVGAAGGIGLQVTRQLQGRARVVAVVQNEQQVTEVAGLSAHSVACDLIDPASVQATVAALNGQCPNGIAGVVFCAAMQPIGPVELFERSALERLFAINVFGSMQLVQGLLPALRQARGRIVLFSSMAGRVAPPLLGAYAGSKYALEALADALRRELRPSGVTVSLIEPGGVDTPMAAAQGSLAEQAYERLQGEARTRYGALVRGYGAMTQAALRHASTPEHVASVAVNAIIGAGQPKPRYVVGTDAKAVILLSQLLPTRWMDALLMKMTLSKAPRG